jgi:hypothetical protein
MNASDEGEMARLLELSEQQAADIRVLEAVVKVGYDALHDLIAACHGADGNLKAPDKKEMMRARSMLPPRYSYALSRKP